MTIMYTSSDSNNTTMGISYLHGANLTIDDISRQLNPNHWWYLWTTKGLGSLQFYFKGKSFWWLFLLHVSGFVFPRTSRSSSNTKRFPQFPIWKTLSCQGSAKRPWILYFELVIILNWVQKHTKRYGNAHYKRLLCRNISLMVSCSPCAMER